MQFKNREHAARLLARELEKYRQMDPLILGIPRGGAPMARTLADELGGDCDVVLVQKLRAPLEPEVAIGAIDEHGRAYLVKEGWEVGAGPEYLARERQVQVEALQRQRELYSPGNESFAARNRTVIVVDDGIATGSTVIAALRAIRSLVPARLIAATAVASPDAVRLIETEADEVVCLHSPEDFRAVGEYFLNFEPVSDDEVVAALRVAA